MITSLDAEKTFNEILVSIVINNKKKESLLANLDDKGTSSIWINSSYKNPTANIIIIVKLF